MWSTTEAEEVIGIGLMRSISASFRQSTSMARTGVRFSATLAPALVSLSTHTPKSLESALRRSQTSLVLS